MAKKKKKKKNNSKAPNKQITVITANNSEQSTDASNVTVEKEIKSEEVSEVEISEVLETTQENKSTTEDKETKESTPNEESENSESEKSKEIKDEPVAENHDNQQVASENVSSEKEKLISFVKALPEKLKKILGNKENFLPIFLISIIAFTILFLLVFLPLIKRSNAIEKIGKGKNEEALVELSGVIPLFGINGVKEEAKTNIVMSLAEELQKTNTKFSSDHFKIESIDDSKVDLNGNFEEVKFKVTFANKDASAALNCEAERNFDGNEWNTDKLEIINTDYLVNKECDENISKDAVVKKYPDAVFVKKGEKNQLYQNFIYSFKSIDEDDPFKYANNQVDVLCTYNLAESKWVVAEMQKTVTSTEEIPYKEFSTAIFKIMLPEAWIMKMNESYNESDFRDEHHISYHYAYRWFASKEDMMSYSERDGGSSLLDITVDGNNYNNFYTQNNNSDTIAVNSNILGRGKMREESYNGTEHCNITFTPRIKGLTSWFTIDSEYADSDKLLEILDQIKIRNATYSIEVLVNELRIRSYSGTSAQIVGHVKKGQKYKATEAEDDYQGYRWFKIGDKQWIADLNGEYLSVKYN